MGTNLEFLQDKILSVVFTPSAISGNTWERLLDFNNGTTNSYFFIAPTFNSGYLRVGLRLGGGSEINYTSPTPVVTSTSTKYIVNVFFDTTAIKFSIGSISGTTITYLASSSLNYSRTTALQAFTTNYFGKSAWNDPYFNAAYHKISITTPAASNTHSSETDLGVFTNLSKSNVVIDNAIGSLYTFDNDSHTVSVVLRSYGTTTVSTDALTIASGSYFDTPQLGGPILPVVITDLSGAATSRTTASLSWSAPTGISGTITGYNVYAGVTLLSGITTPAVSISGTTATLTDCVEGEQYNLTVKVVTADGEVGTSNSVSIIIALPVVITDLSANATSKSSASVYWSVPAGVTDTITGYNVYADGALLSSSTTPALSLSGTTATLTGCIVGQPYNIQVFVMTAAGEVGTSDIVSLMTGVPVALPAGAVLWYDAADASTVTTASGNVTNWSSKGTRLGDSLLPYTGNVTVGTIADKTVLTHPAGATLTGVSNGMGNASTQLVAWRVTSLNTGQYITALRTWDTGGTGFTVDRPYGLVIADGPSGLYVATAASGIPELVNRVSIITSVLGTTSQNYIGVDGTSYALNLENSGMGGGKIDLASWYTNGSWYGTSHDLAEVIFYQSALTTEDRQKAEGYLAWKWGTQSTLPASHPYRTAVILPGSPTDLAASMGATTANLTWYAPSLTGQGPIVDYTVTVKQGETVINTLTATGTSLTVTGLTTGVEYTFDVEANNLYGTSSAVTVMGSTISAPNAPSKPVAVAGNKRVTLTWTDISNSENGITSYQITVFYDGVSTATINTGITDLSATITDLSNGIIPYTFTVAATNSGGTGTASAASEAVYPDALPTGTITLPSGSAAVGQTLTTNADALADEDGRGSLSYQWQRADASAGTYVDIAGETNSTYVVPVADLGKYYRVRVTYTDSAGTTYSGETALYSTVAGPVVPRVPYAPTIGVAEEGLSSAVVRWTPSAQDSGASTTKYTVTPSRIIGGNYIDGVYNPLWVEGPSMDASANATSLVFTGLTAGTTYRFRVLAENSAGPGDYSAESNTVVPYDYPSVPRTLAATPGKRQIILTWSEPSSFGGDSLTISEYRIAITGGKTQTIDICSNGLSSLVYPVSDLSAGITYNFAVTARNSKGVYSTAAATASAVPYQEPGVPQNVDASAGYVTSPQITVSWEAPALDGSSNITLYRITDGSNNILMDVSGTAYSYTFTSLVGGQTYSYTVKAGNAAGLGEASAVVSDTAFDLPGAPTILTVSWGDGEATLTWEHAEPNGSAIISYTIATDDPAVTPTIVAGDATTGTITGLTVGSTYTFTVTAANAAGSGTAAESGSITLNMAPYAPTDASATAGYESIHVSWSAPPPSVSTELLGYDVYDNATNQVVFTAGATDLSAEITGLTAGTPYSFYVVAFNIMGDSTASDPTVAVIPYTAPGAPRDLSANAGYEQIRLTWNAPTSDGYRSITGYDLSATALVGGVTTTVLSVFVTDTSYNHTDLSAGVAYTYNVRTVTTASISTPSSTAVATPYTRPDTPEGVTADASDGYITVSWSAIASFGGLDASGYTVYVTDQSGTVITKEIDGSGTTITDITDLSNGFTYTARVAARNLLLIGEQSAPSDEVIPSSVPSAPRNLVATGIDGAIQLSWMVPANTGGVDGTNVAIASYEVYETTSGSPVLLQTITSGTSATVGDLVNGNEYSFAVLATNVRGPGPLTASTGLVSPNAPPTGSVVITGTVQEDQPLTAVVSGLSDADGMGEISYQWSAADAGTPDIFLDLSGETDATFTPTQSQVNKKIRVTVRYIDGVGKLETVLSTATGLVPNVNDPGSGMGISGTAAFGEVLTAVTTDLSDQDGVPSSDQFSYSWWRSADGVVDTQISEQTGTTFTIGRTEVNNKVRVAVTYTDLCGGSNTVYSPYTATVPPVGPTVPRDLVATRGNTTVALTWNAPEWDGGNSDISYSVWRSTNSDGSSPQSVGTTSKNTRTITASGLTNGVRYYFYVVAYNSYGSSGMSTIENTIPGTVPNPVRNLAKSYASQQVTLTWTAPDSSGGYEILDYKVYRDTSTNLVATVSAGTTSATIAGLTNGVAYTFYVKARNEIGESTAQIITETPSTIPNKPVSASATPTYTTSPAAIVSWTAPDSSGGAAILDYKIRIVGSDTVVGTAAASATSFTVASLTAMTAYRFSVKARNVNGESELAAETGEVTAFGEPDAPTSLSGQYGNATVELSWNASVTNGKDVEYYRVYYASTYKDVSGTQTTTTVTGLTNGTEYTFTVKAKAFDVPLPYLSLASNEFKATPSTVSAPPRNVALTHGDKRITVTWLAPLTSTNGGAAVTGYSIQVWRSDLSGAAPIYTTTVGNVLTALITDVSGVLLENGYQYSIRVASINLNGAGDYSAIVQETPSTLPSEPKNVTVTGHASGSVSLRWSSPDSSGGAAITSYTAYAVHAGGTITRTGIAFNDGQDVSYNFTGLVNGTVYSFTVRAVNRNVVVGNESPASSPAVSEYPSTVPSTPSTLSTVGTLAGVANVNHAAYENGVRLYNATNTNYFGPTQYTNFSTNIGNGWVGEGLILNGTTNRNTTGRSTDKNSANSTAWVNDTPGNPQYIVLDLGSERTFNKAYAYQTFDSQPRKTTQLGLAYAPSGVSYTATDSRLTYSSNTWVSIFDNEPLTNINANSFNLEQSFRYVTTRYVRVTAVNDGTIAGSDSSYIQLYNIKLFYDATASVLDGSDGSIPLTWTAPSSNGDTISKYTITWSISGESVGTTDLSGTATSFTIPSLTNGTVYTVSITATNRDTSSTATTITARPGRVPNAPTGLVAGGHGYQYVDLSWNDSDTDAASGRTHLGYTIYTYNDSTNALVKITSAAAAARSARVTGLPNGVKYRFMIKGRNALGFSAESNTDTRTPVWYPDTPTLTLAYTFTTITASWTADVNSGSAITGYKLYITGGATATIDLSANTRTYAYSVGSAGVDYTFQVEAINGVGPTPSATKTERASKAPEAPVASLVSYTGTTITISWPAPTDNGSALTSYEVYRTTSGTAVATITASGSPTSYTFTGLSTGVSHSVYVRARNRDGWSANSNQVTETTSIAPTVPTITSPPTYTDSTITLSWSAANGYGVPVTYYIYKSLTNSGFEVVDWSGSATTYTSTGLTMGTTYYYKVRAENRNGNNGLSASVSQYPSKKPETPAGFDISGYGLNSIRVKWNGNDISNGAAITSYRLYSSTSAGAAGSYVTIGSTERSYNTTGLTSGTTYYFRLTAVNRDGESLVAAGPVSEKPSAIPDTPTGLPTTPTYGDQSITLTWSWTAANNKGDTSTFYLYRSTDNSGFTTIWNGTAQTYTDTGLNNGTRYYYKISARNRDGESTLSSSVSQFPSKAPSKPAVPTFPSHGLTSITVAWSGADISNGGPITNYVLTRSSTLTGTYSQVYSGTATTYTDLSLNNGQTYYYKVRATNRDGTSPDSDAGSEKPSAVPNPPTGMSITGHGDGTISMSWTAPANANGDTVQYYIVYRSEDGSTFTRVDWSGNATTRTSSGLTNGTRYYFKAVAVNRDGPSAMSNDANEYPSKSPEAPVLSIVERGDTDISLSWTEPASNGAAIQYYRIFQAEASGPFTQVATSATTSALVGSLSYSKTYKFFAIAVNRDNSDNSVTPQLGNASNTVVSPGGAPMIELVSAYDNAIEISYNRIPDAESYNVYYTTSLGGSDVANTTSTTHTFTGLTHGVLHSVYVKCVSSGAEGFASNTISVIPRPTPVAPTTITPIAGDGTITLTWSASASVIPQVTTHYDICGAPMSLIDKTSPTVINGLTNLTQYSLTIVARDEYGSSAPSTAVVSMPVAISTTRLDPLLLDTERIIEKPVSANDTSLFTMKTQEVSNFSSTFVPELTTAPTVSLTTYETNIAYLSIGVDTSAPVAEKAFRVILNAFTENGQRLRTFGVPVNVAINNVSPPDGIEISSPALDTMDIVYSDDGITWEPHSEKAKRVSYSNVTQKSVYTFQTNHFTYFEAKPTNPNVPCFPAGTRVLTAEGFKAIETLRRSDRIVTPDGRALAFRMSSTRLERTTTATAPYHIPAHAFGRNSPPAPVTLSPNHAIQMRAGVWQIPAIAAKLFPTIRQVRVGEPITYYHIQLPNYFTDNIVVEGGVIAESFAGKAMGRMDEIYTYSAGLGGFTRRRGPVMKQTSTTR
jgi:large repetitive protein